MSSGGGSPLGYLVLGSTRLRVFLMTKLINTPDPDGYAHRYIIRVYVRVCVCVGGVGVVTQDNGW